MNYDWFKSRIIGQFKSQFQFLNSVRMPKIATTCFDIISTNLSLVSRVHSVHPENNDRQMQQMVLNALSITPIMAYETIREVITDATTNASILKETNKKHIDRKITTFILSKIPCDTIVLPVYDMESQHMVGARYDLTKYLILTSLPSNGSEMILNKVYQFFIQNTYNDLMLNHIRVQHYVSLCSDSMNAARDAQSDFAYILLKRICHQTLTRSTCEKTLGIRRDLTERESSKLSRLSEIKTMIQTNRKNAEDRYATRYKALLDRKQQLFKRWQSAKIAPKEERYLVECDYASICCEERRLRLNKEKILAQSYNYLQRGYIDILNRFLNSKNGGGLGGKVKLTINCQKFILLCLSSYDLNTDARRKFAGLLLTRGKKQFRTLRTYVLIYKVIDQRYDLNDSNAQQAFDIFLETEDPFVFVDLDRLPSFLRSNTALQELCFSGKTNTQKGKRIQRKKANGLLLNGIKCMTKSKNVYRTKHIDRRKLNEQIWQDQTRIEKFYKHERTKILTYGLDCG
eukprot:23540_1